MISKNSATILFLILAIFFLNIPQKVFGQEATPTIINARILPTVWYSTLSVNDGDNIKIYVGIQNNSGINFTGTAVFYVDEKEISTKPFSSITDSLINVSADWVAKPGNHDVAVKISTPLLKNETLVSYNSEKSNINITKKIAPITKEDVKEATFHVASTVFSKTDDIANSLADKIESFKKPIEPSILSAKDTNKKGETKATEQKEGAVLSAFMEEAADSPIKNKMYSAFNMLLDLFSFLVRNWKWTIPGTAVLYLILKIMR